MGKLRSATTGLVVFGVAGVIYWLVAGKVHPLLAVEAENAYVQDWKLLDARTKQPLETILRWNKGEHFPLYFEFTPKSSLPPTFREAPVTAPEIWPITLRMYRAGEDRTKAPGASGMLPNEGMGRPKGWPVVPMSWGKKFGHGRFPQQRLGKPRPGTLYFSTYVSSLKDVSGELIMDLEMYPTAAKISPVRFRLGEPLVLHRYKILIGE